jgi:hypothetical protein
VSEPSYSNTLPAQETQLPPGTGTTTVPAPRSSVEAVWSDPTGAVPKPEDFNSWPIAKPVPPPKRRVGNAIATTLIVLVIGTGAGIYISGAFTHTHHPRPVSQTDPFGLGR